MDGHHSEHKNLDCRVGDLEREVKLLRDRLDLTEVLRGIAIIISLVREGHRAEMAKIDEESNDLAEQIEEITSGLNAEAEAEQIRRLRALADKLNGMGKTPVPGPTIPVS